MYIIDLETDVDISSKKKLHSGPNKGLVQFTLNKNEELYQGNMDDDSTTKWNQFELNKNKYNVSTTYNENNYTTTLDANLIPQEHKMKTEKIMKDILSVSNTKETNIHLLEERGLISGNDMDEEEKYSSVIRDIGNDNDHHHNK